jgi:signal peptidase I
VKRIRSRVAVVNGIFLVLVGLAWFYLAPAQIGGFTTYVVTHGVSMEPRFHTGDLGLVRPADQYKVGDIVAYHSSLLRTVVLHRIVAIHDGHYTFKGDNNHFLDPEHPIRSQLVGKLWVHLPRAGVFLKWLHMPVVDAVMFGLLGLFLLFGVGEKEQRRRRRRRQEASGSPSHGRSIVSTPRDHDPRHVVDFGAILAASAVAVVAFFALAMFAFTRPAHRTVRRSIPFAQQVSFGYRARVPAGPVYPNGRISTNDPIFLSIVHNLDVRIAYRFSSRGPSTVAGTEEVLLNVIGPSGWTRSFVLTPRTRFAGNATNTQVALNLRQLQSLMAQIERLTDTPGFSSFSLTVQPVVHVTGTVAGHPINANYEPALGFQLQSGQLQPASGSAPSGAASGTAPTSGSANYTPRQAGGVATPASAPASITVLGVSPTIALLRWISIVGLLLSVLATVFLYLRKRGEPFEESVHIQSQYGHLIVPIVAGEDLGWPPVDVPNIKALVRLAESGQRLILHNRSGDVDTYMVNDEGTVYRYQVKASKIVWGEWTDAPLPVDEATVNAVQDSGDAAHSAANAA